MSTIFPFYLPGPTLMYLSLYMLTLAVHFVFMSYVLAGSAYVAVSALRGRAATSPVTGLLCDWLPFALGATITAGVAPLLFLQVLYQENFYTANLLLFHRWMVIIPVLTAGFYLLYLAKSKTVDKWGRGGRAAVALGAFFCFGFTAYSWAENHVLALDQGEWVSWYAAGTMLYQSGEIAMRSALWFCAAVPIMAVLAGWQLWQKSYRDGPFVQTLAVVAAIGCTMTAALGVWFLAGREQLVRVELNSPSAALYLVVIGLGLAAQHLAWWRQWRKKRLLSWAMRLASLGAAMTLMGVIAMRELRRLSVLDVEELTAIHQRVAGAGGRTLFIIALLVNIGVIGWCLSITRRGLRAH